MAVMAASIRACLAKGFILKIRDRHQAQWFGQSPVAVSWQHDQYHGPDYDQRQEPMP
jgi:hypothetical protein